MITSENNFSIGLKSLAEIGYTFEFINKLAKCEDRYELISETKTILIFKQSYNKNFKTLNQWFLEIKDLLKFDYHNAPGFNEYADENVKGFRLELIDKDYINITIKPEYWVCNK